MSAKAKAKTYRQPVKERIVEYRNAVQEAYNSGYRDGYAAYEHIPKVRGAYTAATYGYGRGLKSHKRVEKYQAKSRKQ